MSELTFAEFVELVVRQDVRPERPDDEDAPYLSDGIWELAKRCWVKDPKRRPTASIVCDTLLHLLEIAPTLLVSTPSSASMSVPPPPLPPSQNFVDHRPDSPSSSPSNLTLQNANCVHCAAFSPDGKYIISGCRDNTITLWDALTGNIALGPLEKHTDSVLCVAFSPDGSRISSGSYDNTILVWDAVTGKVAAGPFKGHTGSIFSVCFSPNNKQLASGSGDNKIRVWDARNGYLVLGPLTGHTDDINSVTFSRNGRRIVSGSDDMTVRVWSAQSGRLIHGPLQGHTNYIRFVAFSPFGKNIVSADQDGDVCVWDTDMGALVSGPSKQHAEGTLVVFTSSSTYDCAVSPDGKWVAGQEGGDWHTVQVWNLQTGRHAATFWDHTLDFRSVSFSPDSKRIFTTSNDNTIRIRTLGC